MLTFLNEDKTKCAGCYACLSACPIKCISMNVDKEGFWYPVASDECIHCNKCQIVCPIQNKPSRKSESQQAFAALSKSKRVWQRSASGGAFSEICATFGDTSTMFIGATFDGLEVRHKGVIGYENITPLCKSKYVASKTEFVFEKAENYLKKGGSVVFCGTPCQVSGFRNYLGRDYEKLLLLDLICHGVGSPAVFKDCCYITGEELGVSIKEYEFRSKRSDHETDYLQRITTDNGKKVYMQADRYIQLFLSQKCLRPACGENCLYRDSNRQGDITIADFKGLTEVFPELVGTKSNYSAIVANNTKGFDVVDKLKYRMDLIPTEVDVVKKYNPLFYRQTIPSVNRESFFREYQNDPKTAILNNTEAAIIHTTSITHRIFGLLPFQVRHIILDYLRKGNNGKE